MTRLTIGAASHKSKVRYKAHLHYSAQQRPPLTQTCKAMSGYAPVCRLYRIWPLLFFSIINIHKFIHPMPPPLLLPCRQVTPSPPSLHILSVKIWAQSPKMAPWWPISMLDFRSHRKYHIFHTALHASLSNLRLSHNSCQLCAKHHCEYQPQLTGHKWGLYIPDGHPSINWHFPGAIH